MSQFRGPALALGSVTDYCLATRLSHRLGRVTRLVVECWDMARSVPYLQPTTGQITNNNITIRNISLRFTTPHTRLSVNNFSQADATLSKQVTNI